MPEAKAEIDSGICGFKTVVEAKGDMSHVELKIKSSCDAVMKMAEELTEVEPFSEISFRGKGPLTLKLAPACLLHAACPVPSGIIKAIEVAAELALPADATIKVSKVGE
jgi:hypothetical protein